MIDYFANLPDDAATQIEQLSRLAYELRENRRALLQRHGVDDEAALLSRISETSLDEHPAYEDYLGALAIARTRQAVDEELRALLKRLGG
ncbi:MAG TPA: hypothetical protein VJ743_00835 [Albitalea sp.]|nr:hypothetical protein [Albitalea sp.]